MKPHRKTLIVAIVGLVASLGFSRAGYAIINVPADFASETIVQGLDVPNSMAFLPDGRVLFTEQYNGVVRMVVNGHIALTDPALTVGQVVSNSMERGLQGIAVDPGWPARPYIYVYYTHTGAHCVVARYTGHGDVADSSGENLTFDSQMLLINDIPDNNQNHQAGCVRFGPDSALYVSLGDDEDFCAAADSTLLKGQLLRLEVGLLPDTGLAVAPRALVIPADNPLSSPDSNARLVYAYGMRNPWRFQIDPVTSLIYLADVGEDDFEEIDEVSAGDFLGWPWREGDYLQQRPTCPEPGGEGSIAYRHPIVTYPHNPSLTAIVSGGIYRPIAGARNWPPSYWGDVFYGEYYTGVLRRLKNTAGVWAPAPAETGQPDTTNWGTGLQGVADYLVGPDGNLWWLFQGSGKGGGAIGRIRYFGTDTVDTAVQITLLHSLATPDHVLLEWYVADSGLSTTLYRSDSPGGWHVLAQLVVDGNGHLTYEDRDVVPGRAYSYRLGLVEGGIERFQAETRVTVPARLELAVRGIRPQPGGARLLLAFSLPVAGDVRLEILDIGGRRVRTRDLGTLEAGSQLVRLNDLGLDSGVYLARIVQAGRSAAAKVVIAK